jgi:exopolysaccharide production protein ExoY
MDTRISKPVFRRGIFRAYEIRRPVDHEGRAVDHEGCNENARGHLLRHAGEVAKLAVPPTAKHLPADLALRTNRTRSADTLVAQVAPNAQTSGKHVPVGGVLKRAIDIVVSLLLIPLLAPAMIGTAVLVRLFVGRSVIFPQRRIGFGGTSFVCYKFRTMVVGGDEVLDRYLAANPKAAEEWRLTRKLRDDPRVCSIARLLRKSSLDELPQLFNVLRGDMSLVGPRPIVDQEVQRYGALFEPCFQARPGLSGLWQVSGRNSAGYERRIAFDRYYARRWSIWLDIGIMLKTITTVFCFHQAS